MSEQTHSTRAQVGGNEVETHYKIPKEPGKKFAIFLAGLMHVLLILFLWIGIHWQSNEPVGVDAEIWDMNTRQAAPSSVSTVPANRVESPPLEVKQKKIESSAKKIEQDREAEIATEIATKRANKRDREKKNLENKRLEDQQKEEKLKEEADKKREEQKRKDDLLKEQKKIDAIAKKQRDDNLRRLTSQVSGMGDAVKSTGNNRVDPGYAGKIAAKIKSNMVYVGSDNGFDNPTVDYKIDLFPDGSLRGTPHKIKSSGVPAFDEAVERAITKSAPYPADKSGNVPSTIPLTYRLKD